ncbi:expressed unknown protein [Seminavis robusta]|uniref:Uncharacterized protein n=1 Tax=Seminavis robusta TaxID=568900 RepID=A0A9N8HQ48_9STRA|nr:expressed unknown protein [Seminavis robusta]|eukprot:Sro1401_g269460.1 n/a (195) ;mRNA; f:15235-15819
MLLYCSISRKHKPHLLTNASIGGTESDRKGVHEKKKRTSHIKIGSNLATIHQPSPSSSCQTSAPCIPPKPKANSDRQNLITKHRKTNSFPGASKPSRGRHVRFNSVELQEYAVTLGDHPFCQGHFPLTLDWSHGRPIHMSVRDYEADKARRRYTTSKWEFHMDVRERWERLRLVSGLNETALAHLEQNRQYHRH